MDTEKFGTTKIITAVAAIIVLVLVLVGVNYLNKKQVAKAPTANEMIGLGEPQPAPTGQVAEGFPDYLYLQGNKLTSSYTIPYPADQQTKRIVHQYTISATTGLSIEQEYNVYIGTLQRNGFQILSKNLDLQKEKMARILAASDKATVTVTVYTDIETKKTTAIVNYLEK